MSLKLIPVLAASLIVTGCATVDNTENNPDPLDAAQRAFDHNHWELMALPSIAIVIPGVEGDQTYLENVKLKFGLRVTQGTASGDVKYAETYNHKLLELRGCDAHDPMKRCKR